jgi:hypothetical protein
MNIGTFSADTNRIYREAQNKDYNMNYTRVHNTKYESPDKKKTVGGIIAIGVLSYIAWKNVIKPTINFVKSIMDEIKPEEKESRIMKEKDDKRIFDGHIRVLSKAEADKIRADPNVIIIESSDYKIYH